MPTYIFEIKINYIRYRTITQKCQWCTVTKISSGFLRDQFIRYYPFQEYTKYSNPCITTPNNIMFSKINLRITVFVFFFFSFIK